MAPPSQICPACGAPCLKCRRTQPFWDSAGHELELARQSLWKCTACQARYVLETPAGRLRRIPDAKP